MLHTKFQGNRPGCSGEEFSFRFLTIYGHGSHFSHVIWPKYRNLRTPLPGGWIWNLIEIGQIEKKSLENVDS